WRRRWPGSAASSAPPARPTTRRSAPRRSRASGVSCSVSPPSWRSSRSWRRRRSTASGTSCSRACSAAATTRPRAPSTSSTRCSMDRIRTACRSVIEQPAQQTQILVGGLAPPLSHRDHAAVKVLSSVLGGGMAGRLFVELRDKRALAYTATAFYEPMKEPGVLVLYLGTTPETAAQAEQALLAEIARVKREPVPTEELARAKSRSGEH